MNIMMIIISTLIIQSLVAIITAYIYKWNEKVIINFGLGLIYWIIILWYYMYLKIKLALLKKDEV